MRPIIDLKKARNAIRHRQRVFERLLHSLVVGRHCVEGQVDDRITFTLGPGAGDIQPVTGSWPFAKELIELGAQPGLAHTVWAG